MSWQDILKSSILKVLLEVDPETGIRYKKWDGQGYAPISQGSRNRGRLSGRELIRAAGEWGPGTNRISYDNSGFAHDTIGHQAFKEMGRWFCLACQVEFRMPDEFERAQRREDKEKGEVQQTQPHGISGVAIREYKDDPKVVARRNEGRLE